MEASKSGIVLVSKANISVLSKIPPQSLIEESSILVGLAQIRADKRIIALKIETPRLNPVLALCRLVGIDVFLSPIEYDDTSPGWRVVTSKIERLANDEFAQLTQGQSVIAEVDVDTPNISDVDVSDEVVGVIE